MRDVHGVTGACSALSTRFQSQEQEAPGCVPQLIDSRVQDELMDRTALVYATPIPPPRLPTHVSSPPPTV